MIFSAHWLIGSYQLIVSGYEFCHLWLKMFDFDHEFFFTSWPININRNFYRYFHRHFNSSLNFIRSIDIDWLIYINWFFDDSRYLDSFYNLFWGFIGALNRNLLLYFNIFGHFNNFFNDSFWPRDMLGDLYLDLYRFLNHNLFYDLFWCSCV